MHHNNEKKNTHVSRLFPRPLQQQTCNFSESQSYNMSLLPISDNYSSTCVYELIILGYKPTDTL